MSDTVLITGASRGIGSETAKYFAARGYNVVINYRSSAAQARALAKTLNDNGANVMAVHADVSNPAQVAIMFARIKEWFGGVDVLVNNAGIAQQKLFTDITDEDFNLMMDVNVKGVFNCCRAALPYMIHNKRGRIVNVSSIWGITGASCEVHYSASKAAVIGLTKALAQEVAPSGITVNAVAPGVIDTDMCAGLSEDTKKSLCDETPVGRLGTTADIAAAIGFLCSEDAGFITGQVISPNGGLVV